jgi:TonB family protein
MKVAKIVMSVLLGCWLCQAQQIVRAADKDDATHVEELRYPPLAATARVQGLVVVKVTLDGSGRVLEAEGVSGNDSLVPSCLSNAKKWVFRPEAPKTQLIVYHFTFYPTCNKKEKYFRYDGHNLVTVSPEPRPIDTEKGS